MSRLVCACGTPIPAARADKEHCSTECEQRENEQQRSEEEHQQLADLNDMIMRDYQRQRIEERQGSPAEGMLHLLQAEPTLLSEAPDDANAEHIDHRRLDSVHPCLRCGQRAQVAYIATTDIGNRWLDLCADCNAWMIRADRAGN